MPKQTEIIFLYTTTVILTAILLSGCFGESVAAASGASWFNSDRRTATALADDQAITVKANMALARDKAIWQNSHVSTLTFNSSLLLVGQTSTNGNKSQIEQIVTPIPGVTKIYNQITVTPPISLKARANDTWITTQVKSRLIADRNIGFNRVKIITENKVVYLMGMLTKDEEEIALKITRRVPGVEKVITIIEVAE